MEVTEHYIICNSLDELKGSADLENVRKYVEDTNFKEMTVENINFNEFKEGRYNLVQMKYQVYSKWNTYDYLTLRKSFISDVLKKKNKYKMYFVNGSSLVMFKCTDKILLVMPYITTQRF